MNQIVIGVVSALVTAAALAAGAPAHANANANANADPGAIENWVKQVNRKLDRTIVFPANGRSGVVQATFERDDDGRARAIIVKSGHPAMTRAARHTLNRIRDLPQLPAGYVGKRIRMQMLVGNVADPVSYHDQRKRMLASAQASNVRFAQRNGPGQLAVLATK
ncbi:hypothetical protein [uncultured Sphingomonas sp.]|uniref:hypothetical protein n=1 Tax=uncultured Sphingomonas sp. TaxID=158754 RepID=UPI0035CC8D40